MLLSGTLLTIVLIALLDLATEWAWVEVLAALSVLPLPLVAFKRLQAREYYLLSVCALLTLLAWVQHAGSTELFVEALDRSSFLVLFILMVGALREGALNAASVQAVGRYLTRQPPSRRFLSVFLGGHYFALLANLGALSLFAPIIQSGVRAQKAPGETLTEVERVRERRQLTALMRGFSWILVWAPTAVTQAVLPTLIDGLQALKMIALGALLASIMLVVSWAEDALSWRSYSQRRAAMNVPRPPVEKNVPWWAVGVLALVSAGLFASAIALVVFADRSLIGGIVLTIPALLLVWFIAQRQSLTGGVRRFTEVATSGLAVYTREALFIACAGFIGSVAATLIPIEQLAAALSLGALSDVALLMALVITIWLGGQIGLSPITVSVFLGSLIATLINADSWPLDVTLSAFAITVGTALSTCGAPFSAGAVVLARATGYPARQLTWAWNGRYVAITLALLVPFFWLIVQF